MGSLFGKPKAPETPDYRGLAEQQGEINKEAALDTSRLASPNESNPWGSINRAFDDKTGQWTYSTQLSPELHDTFDKSMSQLQGAWGQPFDTSGMTDRVTGVNPSSFSGYQMDPGKAPGYQQALELGHLGNRPSLDFSGLPDLNTDFSGERSRVEDALYQQQSTRLDPEWQQRERALTDRLYSQGIREGSEAWTKAFDDFNRQRNQAYEGARLSSITGAGQEHSRLFGMSSQARGQMATEALASAGFSLDERSQGVAEALTQGNFANAVTQLERNYGLDRQAAINMATQLENQMKSQEFDQGLQNAILANTGRAAEMDEAAFKRNLPYNEMSALLAGVSPGAFGGPTVAPGVQGAPMYQAGQDQYQAEYNRYAQEMSRLNSLWQVLGQAGGQMGAAAISDRRFKSNIVQIGQLPSGLNVYEYDIGQRREQGVMADEAAAIFPDAVIETPLGHLMVDYARIS